MREIVMKITSKYSSAPDVHEYEKLPFVDGIEMSNTVEKSVCNIQPASRVLMNERRGQTMAPKKKNAWMTKSSEPITLAMLIASCFIGRLRKVVE